MIGRLVKITPTRFGLIALRACRRSIPSYRTVAAPLSRKSTIAATRVGSSCNKEVAIPCAVPKGTRNSTSRARLCRERMWSAVDSASSSTSSITTRLSLIIHFPPLPHAPSSLVLEAQPGSRLLAICLHLEVPPSHYRILQCHLLLPNLDLGH